MIIISSLSQWSSTLQRIRKHVPGMWPDNTIKPAVAYVGNVHSVYLLCFWLFYLGTICTECDVCGGKLEKINKKS